MLFPHVASFVAILEQNSKQNFLSIIVALALGAAASAQEFLPDPVIAPFGVANAAANSAGVLTPELAPGGILVVRGVWLGPESLTLDDTRIVEISGSRIEVRSIETGEVFQAQMLHAW